MENKFVLWVALVLGGISLLAQENPREVIRRGRENGWPELSINHTMRAF